MVKILHFADAHIDMVSHGKHDPETGLPVRVVDFLNSLDQIVDTAIDEHVDMVIFAGDAYKDRNPAPTFQREWGKRIMRLSKAGIPTLLLVGNHDLSPAIWRAHALDAFTTLEVPHVYTIDKPAYLHAADLENVPVQVLAIPWIPRSGLVARFEITETDPQKINEEVEENLGKLINMWLSEQRDPSLPTILTAHVSVLGATYGMEREVMLGGDLVLPASLVKDPRLDYVALGHIHKAQNLNEGAHPPVIYPGSIERVDFGEEDDKKYFVIADVQQGNTSVEWRELDHIRPFFTARVKLTSPENATQTLIAALPKAKIRDAYARLIIEYQAGWEAFIDENAIRQHASEAFEFQINKRPQHTIRARLPGDESMQSKSPLELLEIYWHANDLPNEEIERLKQLAQDLLSDDSENQVD